MVKTYTALRRKIKQLLDQYPETGSVSADDMMEISELFEEITIELQESAEALEASELSTETEEDESEDDDD